MVLGFRAYHFNEPNLRTSLLFLEYCEIRIGMLCRSGKFDILYTGFWAGFALHFSDRSPEMSIRSSTFQNLPFGPPGEFESPIAAHAELLTQIPRGSRSPHSRSEKSIPAT